MHEPETPVLAALRELVALSRGSALGSPGLHALAWLAAARMVVSGAVPALDSPDRLADPASWTHLLQAGLPAAAVDLVQRPASADRADEIGRRAASVRIIADLVRAAGTSGWDVLPALGSILPRSAAEPWLAPDTVRVLTALAGRPSAAGPDLWIPFDPTGQLTVQALRLGWRVRVASPWSAADLLPTLLLAIETGRSRDPRVVDGADRDPAGSPGLLASCTLVVPPPGPLPPASQVAGWDRHAAAAGFDRSETWAIAALRDRASGRAVFAGPQNLLFAQGQDARLRRALFVDDGETDEGKRPGLPLAAVVTLAAAAGEPAAALVFEPGPERDTRPAASSTTVWMADLGTAPSTALDRVTAREAVPGRAGPVPADAIAASGFSLLPSRHLQRLDEPGRVTVRLGDLCRPVRPPAQARGAGAGAGRRPGPGPGGPGPGQSAAEIGLPELGRWRTVDGEPQRSALLKAAPDGPARLRPGDLVISIKGSVGRVGLVGAAEGSAGDRPRVVSQSCLGLRIGAAGDGRGDAGFVSPEYLLLFLRSAHAQAQLRTLQAGTTVRHVSPATLLDGLRVPVPTADEHVEALEDYRRLCELEAAIDGLAAESAAIGARRWAAAGG